MDTNQPITTTTTTLPNTSNIILQLSLYDIKNLVTQQIITSTQASQIWNMHAPQESILNRMQSFDQKPPLTIDSQTDLQHILLNDYYLLNIIPLYYVLIIIAFLVFQNSFRLLDLIIKQEKIAKPMKILGQFFKLILIVIAVKFAMWLESGQAFVLSLVVILFTCIQLREQIIQPIIFYLFVDDKKKKEIDDYLEKFRQKQEQKESDLMQNFIYSSQLNSLNHPALLIALILLFSQVIFFFVASLFLFSEFITVLLWLNMTFVVSFVTQIFKKFNMNKFPFEPIIQIILSLLLPVIGMLLDRIIVENSYHSFISICVSILPISSGIQNLIYMLLLDDAIELRSKLSYHQFRLQVGKKLGNLQEMDKISGWKKKLSAFIILALPLFEIYIGLRKSIWPLLVTGFFTFKNVSMIYFTLVKNAMLFDTLTPIFLLFMTFQMNQRQIDSYSNTPVLSYFIEQSTMHFQVFYFAIRMAAFVSLITLSGTLQTMKKQFEAAKKFNSDQEQSALQKSGTLQFFEFVYSVFWAHLIVSLSLYFAQLEQSAFFSLIYQLIAIFFMIKPNIGILVINGLWKIEYAIMLSTLLAWRLSILSLNLFLPFQASGILFCLSILLTVLVQDEKKSKYLQTTLMAIFFLHGMLTKSNIYIFEFAVLLHLLVPITNSLMKKRNQEKLRTNNQQDGNQSKQNTQGVDQKKKSSPEYLLLWICVFCFLGFSFGTITEGVYDFMNSITGNIILERFYSIEFKQFEIILASKAVNLFESFTQVV